MYSGRRQERRYLGLCIDCGDEADGIYCAEHKQRRNAMRTARIARNKERVRTQQMLAQRKRRQMLERLKRCADCGMKTEGYRCEKCQNKHRSGMRICRSKREVPVAKITFCPNCGKQKNYRSIQCNLCAHAGRPGGEDFILAKELGVSKRSVTRAGGATKLRAMDESARNLILGIRRSA